MTLTVTLTLENIITTKFKIRIWNLKKVKNLRKMKRDIDGLTNFKIEKQITATSICTIKLLV